MALFLAKSTLYLAIFPKNVKKCKKMKKNRKKICIYQNNVVILRCLSKTRGSRTPKRNPKTEKK